MQLIRRHSSTSNILRVVLRSSVTGAGLTGLAHDTSGLIISTITDNEASATTYTAAGSTIETISTLGTFAAPTATKCRFKEVDATNQKGLYELQFADARFSVASAKQLDISIDGAANLLKRGVTIQLDTVPATDGTGAALATPTNITAGTITTVTNLTNAPTNGDLTATMKTSVTTAATAATPTAAAVTGAVGSVTGNVGGSVGSIAANGITASSIAADAINAAAVKADAVTKLQSGLATSAAVAALPDTAAIAAAAFQEWLTSEHVFYVVAS